MQLALPLGADVPVFVFGQSAFAEGVGEALSAVALPPRAYVVAQPFQHVATSAVFSAPDLTRTSHCVNISVFSDCQDNMVPVKLPGCFYGYALVFGAD